MRRTPFVIVSVLMVVAGVALSAWATTWGPMDFVCPICKTKNTFQSIMSYGGYIYYWPEKFQLIFWPTTTNSYLYHCKKCHYTASMGEFDKPPADKVEAIRQTLQSVKMQYDTRDYSTIPMFERLEVAQKVYEVWGKNDDFWCHFYRVKGYHLQHEKKPAEADAARQKALELAQKMVGDSDRAGQRKELLLISGAMRHYLRDDKAALIDLEEAATLKYENPKLKPEQNQNYDGYLSALLKEYIKILKEGGTTDPKEEPDDAFAQ